jgi:hypothetical protein
MTYGINEINVEHVGAPNYSANNLQDWFNAVFGRLDFVEIEDLRCHITMLDDYIPDFKSASLRLYKKYKKDVWRNVREFAASLRLSPLLLVANGDEPVSGPATAKSFERTMVWFALMNLIYSQLRELNEDSHEGYNDNNNINNG